MAEAPSDHYTVFGFKLDKSVSVIAVVQVVLIIGGFLIGGVTLYSSRTDQIEKLSDNQAAILTDLAEVEASISVGVNGLNNRITELEKRVNDQEEALAVQGVQDTHLQSQLTGIAGQLGGISSFLRDYTAKER